MRRQREKLSVPEKTKKDEQLFQNMALLTEEYLRKQPKGTVCCYVSLENEADTRQFLSWTLERGLFLAVPRVRGREMEFCKIASLKALVPGCYGILEPETACAAETPEQGLMLIPGLAFDRAGNRLGYGGGYYDRYLRKNPQFLKAGISYEFQIMDRLPAEEWDVPVDWIVTEVGICKITD